ncbi:cellobiose transport system substrate-binding protein [Kribbella antiqua]|uniref:Cellobiose transport system substrate-binding protein n=1 Tax=Kribbella antiqua TaxID=2512217 RepID=A0A4V2S2Z1_9ACTN|nr:extracellular solute-binding protein [Kribbella antiqua]TCO42310.1 cellobiose transport system substrate-binding protein [Kribbella antiqua]
MRSRIAVAIAAAVTLAAAGCSGGGSGNDGGDQKSFEFWSFSGINQKAAVDEYQQKHPDIHIKLTEVGSSVETAQALTTALAGGKVPDLVLIQGDDLPKFVEQPQNFVDLRSLGADDVKKDYLDWVWSQSVAKDGEVLGVPTDVGGLAIAYRTDLFAAAKLPTDRDAVSKLWPTWDKFIEVGKQYKAATGKPFVDNASTSVFYQAVNQGDMKFYDADRNLAYDHSPQVKEAFDYALTAAQAGITAKLSSFSEGWSAGMAKGDFAVLAAPSWMLGGIRSNAPATKGKWDIATIPGGAGNWGGSYLAIPKNAKNQQAAWNYIKEMQSPQSQLAHYVGSGSLPSTPAVYKDAQLTSHKDPFFSNAPTGKIYTESLLGLKPFYIGPDSSAIGQEFQNVLTNVEQGKGDPGTAWDTALKNIKTAIGK